MGRVCKPAWQSFKFFGDIIIKDIKAIFYECANNAKFPLILGFDLTLTPIRHFYHSFWKKYENWIRNMASRMFTKFTLDQGLWASFLKSNDQASNYPEVSSGKTFFTMIKRLIQIVDI